MLMVILITALVAVLFYYFIVKPYDYWKDRGIRQGKPIWVFGDSWGTAFKRHNFSDMISYVYNQCPGTRYSGVYQFFLPALLVKDPDLLKQMTVKDFDYFTDHNSTIGSEDDDPVWGKNLFALKGQKWREMRAILSPSFTTSKMKSMFVLITDCAEDFVQHFLRKDQKIITVEMKDIFTRFTNDVIASTAFGIKVDSLEKPNNEFYLMGKEAMDFTGLLKNLKMIGYFLVPKLYAVLKIPLFDKKVGDFFTDLVNTTIKAREEQAIFRPDMINLLMETGKEKEKGKQEQEENGILDTGFATAQESDMFKSKVTRELTNEDIASQALIFFFAGFETVSTLMCFTSYELAVHPDVQDRLRKEVQSTVDEYGGKITYEGLTKMKYMDMVISEVLRKWPNTVTVDRVCTKPYTIEPASPEEKPLDLKKGDVFWLPIFGMHRDPKYFPDPDRFDPERFSDENKGKIKPYTYFPFGLGPRNCIGSRFALLEVKTVFFKILLHFEIVPVKKTPIPMRLSKKTVSMTADGGFWLGLKRIKT